MVFVSIITLFGLGLVAAILLSIASRVFYVKEDPRVEAVLEVLPGANCGGCGFAGCEGYAAAVVSDPDIPANKCCAGGADTAIAVGELTGKTVAEADIVGDIAANVEHMRWERPKPAEKQEEG